MGYEGSVAFGVRGVIEGFYGRPWSWSERERMLRFMGAQGFNLFVYAPKNDPIHRDRWREPYLPEELQRFGRLAAVGRDHGVEVAFGLSPLHFHYSDPDELAAFTRKLGAVRLLGIESFSLLLDDMPSRFRFDDDLHRFGTLAHAQAWLCRELLTALPGTRLIFTPTEYHGSGRSAYLETLGHELPREVDIFWTGPQVCSPEIPLADALTVGETLGRPVLYWDNYPVNDLDMRYDLHLRPLIGRDPRLPEGCRGLVANGALGAEASKVALHTVAAYLADPAGYDPELAWHAALLEVAGDPDDAAAARILGELARRSPLEPGGLERNPLRPVLERFWRRWGGPPTAAGPALPTLASDETSTAGSPEERAGALREVRDELDRLAAAAERLLGPVANPKLAADLRPWALKLRGWARVGTLALDTLALPPGGLALPDAREAVLDALLETRENFHWVAGDLVDQFARRCLWASRENARD